MGKRGHVPVVTQMLIRNKQLHESLYNYDKLKMLFCCIGGDFRFYSSQLLCPSFP